MQLVAPRPKRPSAQASTSDALPERTETPVVLDPEVVQRKAKGLVDEYCSVKIIVRLALV